MTRTVSSRVSPFFADEVSSLMPMTRPPRRSIAAVNELHVRVEGSMKMVASTLSLRTPSTGDALSAERNAAACSSTASIDDRSNCFALSTCLPASGLRARVENSQEKALDRMCMSTTHLATSWHARRPSGRTKQGEFDRTWFQEQDTGMRPHTRFIPSKNYSKMPHNTTADEATRALRALPERLLYGFVVMHIIAEHTDVTCFNGISTNFTVAFSDTQTHIGHDCSSSESDCAPVKTLPQSSFR
jgi:hypothetical protein